MMKKYLWMMGIAAALLITGCTTSYRDAGGDGLLRPSGETSTMYHTEYEISQEQVKGHGSAEVILWLFHISDDKICLLYRAPNMSLLSSIFNIFSPTQKAITNAKGAALFEALEASNADHIVGATFDYEVRDCLFFARVKCTAKGYPARVKSIRSVDKVPMVINEWQKVEYVAPGVLPMDYSNKLLPDKKVKLF